MAVVIFIVTFLLLITIFLILSTIQIRIPKLYISNETGKLQLDYEIFLELKIFNKLKFVSVLVTPNIVKKLNKKINFREKMKAIDLKQAKADLPSSKQVKEIIKKLNINLEKIHLSLNLGTKDVIITSAIITLISIVLGIVLARSIKHYEKEKYEYKIMPIYQDKNVIKLSLDCIIHIKVVHIISIIYMLGKNRKEKRRHERTSNRRSYDDCYE